MQVQTPTSKPRQGNIEAYAIGDHVSLYIVRGAESPAILGSTVALAKLNREEARELMGTLAKLLSV